MKNPILENVRKMFVNQIRICVKQSRQSHVFVERVKDGRVFASYDTRTSDPLEAAAIIRFWMENGFPEKKKRVRGGAFAEFCERYWAEDPEARNPTKIHANKNIALVRNYVAPFFKSMDVGCVTPGKVREFYDTLRRTESRRGLVGGRNRYLAPSTIRHIKNAICLPLQYAGAHGLNEKAADWLVACRLKKVGNREDSYFGGMVEPRDIFEPRELALLDAAEWGDARVDICYKVLRWTGMRYGEVRGLKIGKILRDRIIIDAAYNSVDKEKCTKTGWYREMPIPEWLYIEIRKYVASLPPEMQGAECWLLPGKNGEPVGSDFFGKKFDAMLARLKIPKRRKVRGVIHTRSPHSLRHCKDMELLNAGLGIKQISTVIGHSPVMVAHYTNHYSSAEFDDVAAKMREAGLLDKPKDDALPAVRMA